MIGCAKVLSPAPNRSLPEGPSRVAQLSRALAWRANLAVRLSGAPVPLYCDRRAKANRPHPARGSPSAACQPPRIVHCSALTHRLAREPQARRPARPGGDALQPPAATMAARAGCQCVSAAEEPSIHSTAPIPPPPSESATGRRSSFLSVAGGFSGHRLASPSMAIRSAAWVARKQANNHPAGRHASRPGV